MFSLFSILGRSQSIFTSDLWVLKISTRSLVSLSFSEFNYRLNCKIRTSNMCRPRLPARLIMYLVHGRKSRGGRGGPAPPPTILQVGDTISNVPPPPHVFVSRTIFRRKNTDFKKICWRFFFFFLLVRMSESDRRVPLICRLKIVNADIWRVFIAKRVKHHVWHFWIKGDHRTRQNNVFLMIPSSWYIKVYFLKLWSKVSHFFLLFSLYFSCLNLKISQIYQNGYNPVLRWNSSFIRVK